MSVYGFSAKMSNDSTSACLICLNKDNCKTIFNAYMDTVSYPEIFTSCTGLTITENSQLLSWICVKCEIKLLEFHKFRLKCIESYTFLTSASSSVFEYIEQHKEIKEEPIKDELNLSSECDDYLENEELLTNIEIFKSEDEADITEDRDDDVPLIQLIQKPKTTDKTAKSNTKDLINCKICNEIFNDKKLLKEHKKKTHKKTFPCSFCSKFFLQNTCKVLHERRYHTKIKPYKCNSCKDRSFYSKSDLNVHNKRHHSPIKAFECNICAKKFSVKSDLRLHLPIHSTHKIKQCDLCGKQFSRTTSLNIHKQHHKNDDIANVPCKLCNAKFKKKRDLWKHIRENHKFDHNCEFCGRTFEKAVHLQTHRKVHAVNKIHVCSICPDKKFCENHQLRRHLRDSHPGIELPPVIKSKDRSKNKEFDMFGETAV